MKKELKKITAMVSAVLLASQCMSFIGAEEAKAEKAAIDQGIYESILKSDPLADKNKDGVISEDELADIFSLTLDGSIIKELKSLKDLEKMPEVQHLKISNWKDFDVSLLKDLKGIPSLELLNVTLKKSDEKIPEINHITVYNTEEFDLDTLKAFTSLITLSLSGTTVKDLSAIEALDLKRLYIDEKIDSKEITKYIKNSDYEVPEGFLVPVAVRPAGAVKGEFISSDPETVQFTGFSTSELSDSIDEGYYNYFFAKKQGETEYTYKNKTGDFTLKGKIKIVADKPVDEPLLNESLAPLTLMTDDTSDQRGYHGRWLYFMTEDGSVYSYNKQGKGETDLCYTNVAKFKKDSYGNYLVLDKDGFLKINDEDVNTDYRIISSSENLNYFLCNDGVLRSYVPSKDKYVIEEVCGDVKAITEDYGYSDIIQTADGKTVLTYSETVDGKKQYKLLDLNLSITPVKIIRAESVVMNGGGLLLRGGTFYVIDDKNDLYMIKVTGSNKSKEVTKSVARNKIASDVSDIGYFYRPEEGRGSKAIVAYTDKDGKAYNCADGKALADKGEFELYKNEQYDYDEKDTKYIFDEHTTATGKTIVSDDSIYGLSYHAEDGTERFTCLDHFASFTHVKQTYGTFFDGGDYNIIIVRDDNTVWKYAIEANTFTRLDTEFKAPEPLGPRYSAADLVTMMRYLCGLDDGTGSDWLDLNGDGKVNILDFIHMKKEILSNM